MEKLIIILLLSITDKAQTDSTKFVFENNDFLIKYNISLIEDYTLIDGLIFHKKNNAPALGTNIWTECKNQDGTQNGTVPEKNGNFSLILPENCNEIKFLKYYYDEIILKLEKIK